jgi:hypothetical protein
VCVEFLVPTNKKSGCKQPFLTCNCFGQSFFTLSLFHIFTLSLFSFCPFAFLLSFLPFALLLFTLGSCGAIVAKGGGGFIAVAYSNYVQEEYKGGI